MTYLVKKTFLKIFLRRMICSCEFGICLNFNYENTKAEDPTLMIDKDPLLTFTLSVKSLIPVLAGVLIFVLVYLGSLAKEIAEWICNFPGKITKEVVLLCINVVVDVVAPEIAGVLLDQAISFLQKCLNKQLSKLKEINSKTSQQAHQIIKTLIKIFNSSLCQDIAKKATNYISDCIKIN